MRKGFHMLLAAGLAVIASVTIATVAVAMPGADSATWRTVVIATDVDVSEHGSSVLEFGTTLDRVSAWRVVARADVILEATVRIHCGEGLAERRRDVTVWMKLGTYALPVPVPGDRCVVSIIAGSTDPGAATVKLQFKP